MLVESTSCKLMEVKRIKENEYSVLLYSFIWHQEWSFTFVDTDEYGFDLRHKGDLQLLASCAHDYYVEKYKTQN